MRNSLANSSDLADGPVRDLFAALNSANIQYVVLRGYLPVTELEVSLDIDVLVAPQDVARAQAAIRDSGWRRRRLQAGRYPHIFFDHLGGDGVFLQMFDVVTGLCYGGDVLEFDGVDAVLARATEVSGVRVPHPWHALLLLALHQLFDKDSVLPHHRARVRQLSVLCREHPEGVAALNEDFGAVTGRVVDAFVAAFESGDSGELDECRRMARRITRLKPRPVRAFFDPVRSRIQRRLARPVRVAFVGLDGAGKSTLVERFLASSGALPVGTAYLGYNLFHTRTFRKIVRRLEDQTEAESRSVRGRLLDLAREFVWPFEVKARMRRAERGRMLVIYDRFPLRGLDPSGEVSTFRTAIRVFTRALRLMVPPPDIVLFLDGEADVLWPRKKEYPLDVFLSTQKRYREVIPALPYEHQVIRTDGNVKESLAQIFNALSRSPAVRKQLLDDWA